MAGGVIIGDDQGPSNLSIRRRIFRLCSLAFRHSLAFTRNPRLRAWMEVVVTSNTRVKC